MSSVRIRINEGDDKQPILLWDSVWVPQLGMADWAMFDPDEAQNQGGLRSKAALHTAVILALFTDKRMPADHPLRYLVPGHDMRGWWGDGVDVQPDLGEREMGSLWWVFERAPLTEDIRRYVESFALDALATLIMQGAAVRIEADAYAQFAENRCDCVIKIYGRDGSQIYNYRFDDIWQQPVTSPKPSPFPQLPYR